MRPFEVDDWVMFNGCTGHSVVIHYEPDTGKVYFDNGYFTHESNVKTIRKPRHGGKEARDICAMLGRNTLDVKRRYNHAFTKDIKSIFAVSYNVSLHLFNESKSMLQVQNETV